MDTATQQRTHVRTIFTRNMLIVAHDFVTQGVNTIAIKHDASLKEGYSMIFIRTIAILEYALTHTSTCMHAHNEHVFERTTKNWLTMWKRLRIFLKLVPLLSAANNFTSRIQAHYQFSFISCSSARSYYTFSRSPPETDDP